MRHLIVGAGPAAQNAIETIRSLDERAEIALVCDEPAYSRMVLPYYLAGDIEAKGVMSGDAAWFEKLRVRTCFGRRVMSLDPKGSRVRLDDESQLPYDRLLLATGSRVARPAIPGVENPRVVDLWTLENADAFLQAPHREVVIVGAGFIAFTILDAIAKRAERVSFIEMEPRVLPRMLDARAARLVEARLAERGIAVHTGERLERIDEVRGHTRLLLSGGQTLTCDIAIMATGVRANLEFLNGSGIEIDQGILVNERLQTSVDRVFAAGDVAQGPDLLGGPRRVQAIQPTAVDHGRVAGANMVGLGVAYSGSLTMNVLSAVGLEACSFGRWQESRDTVVVENMANRIYRKYVFEDDRIVGGVLLGPTVAVSGVNDVGMLKGLIQTGVRLGPWKRFLSQNPLDLRRPYLASGAAEQLLGSTLLAGHALGGGGFRLPPVRPRRFASAHQATFQAGASS